MNNKYQYHFLKSTSKNGWIAIVILLLGLLLTFVAVLYTQNEVEMQAKNEFALVCNEIKTKILARLHSHAQLLRDGSSFFAASDTVTRKEWRLFIEHSNLNKNLPGIQGVGFSIIIPQNQLQQHIKKIRSEGFPDYTVKPAGNREIYTSIIYLEPFADRNLRAFGYDMYSEPIRRKAMEQARDFNVAALSGKVILVQETDKDMQAGTLMYVPVYRNETPTNTIEERRAAIIGWVYSPYRMSDLMLGILGGWGSDDNNKIHLKIYDNENISYNSLLFDNQRNDTISHNDISASVIKNQIEFNEKKWTLQFSQFKEHFSTLKSKALIVLVSGIAISLLLFSLILSLFNTRYNAQQIAEHLTLKIKESEEKFSLFMDHLPAFVFIKDNEGRTLYTNQFMDKAVNTSGWMGKNMVEIFPNEFGEKLYADDMNVLKDGYQKIEESIIQTDGKLHHFETQKFIIPNFEQNLLLGGISLDITDRKQAIDFLQQTRKNYETFFNTIDEFLFVLDTEGNILYTNSTVVDRLGYSPEELLGKSVLMFHPIERRDEAGRIVGEMLNGKSEFCPVPLITKSGIQIPVETRVSHGFWDGLPVIFGVTKDISKLKFSEEKFSKLFHINPSACGLSNLKDGKYIEVNDAFYSLFGFDKNEVIGKTATELGVLTNEARSQILLKADGNGKITNVETDLKAKNGEIKYALLSAENIYVQNKKYRFTVAHDITERKQTEFIIQQQYGELKKLNSDKDRFISILAHDLKSPFNGILGLLDLLVENFPDFDIKTIENYMKLICNSAHNTYDLLEAILTWARSQSGKIPFQPQKLSIMDICNEVIEILYQNAKSKDITIVLNNSDEVHFFADKDMLNTILRNLISNAIKFTDKGGIINIYAMKNQSDVTISISDNGVGIEPNIIEKLFDFSQKISTLGTDNEKGTGLGLVLCKDFVEKHGGKIWVESEIGKGSIFNFSIPFKQ